MSNTDVLQKYASHSDPIKAGSTANSSIVTGPEYTAPPSSTSENQIQLGGELATIFKDRGVHPVLIFGSQGSGKTALVASMFRYLMDSAQSGASLELREDIFPVEDTRWQRQISWARDVYYKKVIDYIYSKAPPATLETEPFFIPVKLTRTTGEEASFAFLEGRGEWYMPVEGEEVPFQRFQGLLQGMLQQYSGPVTVIYVAPYTTGGYSRSGAVESSQSESMTRSDLGLLGAINEFITLRKAQFHNDHHLFLMTKWDIRCDGIASNDFRVPSSDIMENAIQERYRMSWSRFQKLNFPEAGNNKTFSVYCSGIINEQAVLRPAQDDIETIDQYPRKIWDWIYKRHTGQHLYTDMQPVKESFLDRMIRAIRG